MSYIQQIAKNQLLAELAEADWEGELRGLARRPAEGKAEGLEQRNRELILRAHQNGQSAEQIAEFLDLEISFVQSVLVERS